MHLTLYKAEELQAFHSKIENPVILGRTLLWFWLEYFPNNSLSSFSYAVLLTNVFVTANFVIKSFFFCSYKIEHDSIELH